MGHWSVSTENWRIVWCRKAHPLAQVSLAQVVSLPGEDIANKGLRIAIPGAEGGEFWR